MRCITCCCAYDNKVHPLENVMDANETSSTESRVSFTQNLEDSQVATAFDILHFVAELPLIPDIMYSCSMTTLGYVHVC